MTVMIQMVENSETHNITLFVLISAIVGLAGFIGAAAFISITHRQKKKNKSKRQHRDDGHPENLI